MLHPLNNQQSKIPGNDGGQVSPENFRIGFIIDALEQAGKNQIALKKVRSDTRILLTAWIRHLRECADENGIDEGTQCLIRTYADRLQHALDDLQNGMKAFVPIAANSQDGVTIPARI